MINVPVEVRENLARLTKEADPEDPLELARRILAILPGYGPAYLLIGTTLFAAGKLDEAEAALWEGLQHEPCRAPLYLNLAEVRTKRSEGDVLAKRLRHLALWKLSFEDKIPPPLAALFEKLLGDEAHEPETYERLALYEEIEVEKAVDPPEVVARLLPYRLLNDLQREAPDDLSELTLGEILEHATECEPIFRNALRQWGRDGSRALDGFSVSMLIAILGEISGPDAVDELLELAYTGDRVIFLHVHWAISRLGMRYPEAVLERFREAARDAPLKLRCALADQIDLLEDVEGDVDALASLLDGFELLAKEDDAPYLLAEVVYALTQRDELALAQSLVAKYESTIPEKDRPLLHEALKPDGEFVSMLIDAEVDVPDIEGVCLERYFLSEDEEGEDELEEFEDGELEEPVDLEPPRSRRGRNDPCWCGSGKKYKKCHLDADEEAERAAKQAESDEDEARSLPDTLHSRLMAEVFSTAVNWLGQKTLLRAKRKYFDTDDSVEATPDEMNGFVQWLLHDFRDPASRRTPIEYFLQMRSSKLDPAERELLQTLRDARFGLYQVETVEPGSGIHVEDLSTGEMTFVHDRSSSASMDRWDTLLARLQFHEGRCIFAGDGSMVPRRVLEDILEVIERERRPVGQTKADFIRANSHRLHRVVKDLLRHKIAGLKIVNNEGEDVEFGLADYEVSDEAALLRKLRSLEELEEDRTGKEGYHGFNWIQPIGGERRPFGYVRVGYGLLRLEAPSRTRLQTGRGLLEVHAGGLLKHVGDSYTGIEEIKQKAMGGSAPSRSPSFIPPEVEREVVLRYKTEHYAKWVDDRLPALGDKTPRQAVKTPGGRKAVIDLIRTLENMEARELRQGRPAYDVNILRRELGLEDE